jgi:lysophospholipase L1-like esterase
MRQPEGLYLVLREPAGTGALLMKAGLQNVALTVASILVACILVEGGLHVFGPEVLMLGDPYVFNKFDPVLGWSGLPNHRGVFIRTEFAHSIESNSLGMRDREVVEKRGDEFRVAVLGDSFTWGVGAAYGARFTEVVEALDPRINALNFGVSGYSPIQYLLQIDQVLSFKPDYVIVTFCLGNDLFENISPSPYLRPKPYAELSADGSKLEIAGYPLSEPKVIGLASYSRLLNLTERGLSHIIRSWTGPGPAASDDAMLISDRWLHARSETLTARQQRQVGNTYKVNELLLDSIRQRVENAIGPHRLAVVLAPTKSEYGLTSHLPADADRNIVAEHLLASLSLLGIPAIDGRTAISAEDFWKRDAHWRPSGHAKLGKLIADYLASVMPQAPHAAVP